MADIYRDARGRFSTQQRATRKQSGNQHYIWLFSKWAELKPVTPKSLRARMVQYDEALRRAM